MAERSKQVVAGVETSEGGLDELGRLKQSLSGEDKGRGMGLR